MAALATDLRNRLENTVKKAREEAERGARQALEALAVDRREAHASMSAQEKALRNRLRAHGRQLGDVRTPAGTQAIDRLIREVAYEHWHRMLFARFLVENDLLIHPDVGVALTMQECEELARERGEDPWALAASFAQTMLPQIFRVGDPALEISLPPETRQNLQRLLSELPRSVFTEDDSLGWTYQFWQAAEKKAVNARAEAGEKITGETLPAVTQLFTEPYMVEFLLHNTIGAWYAGRTLPADDRAQAESEEELRRAVRLAVADGYDFTYLRFVREGEEEDGEAGAWRPAAGSFDRWPDVARELTVLDPCCGSGHFLVAAFDLLARLRMEEEGVGRAEAARAVIGDNLFGLELDARCTQIAAFNLALAAWKFVGRHVELPPMRVACSGVGPEASKQEWLALAEEAARAGGMPGKEDLFEAEETLLSSSVRGGLEALYNLFQKAPDLGSLIDPRSVGGGEQTDALEADLSGIEPVLDAILAREATTDEDLERAVAAKGMAEAARILTGPREGYTLVITNVPYLGRGSHTDAFKRWAERNHGDAKNDLATIFVSRMLRWVEGRKRSGTVAAVTPQNWLFLTTYRKLRERLLTERSWEMVARLGPGAFETISGEVVNVALLEISGHRAEPEAAMAGVDVAAQLNPREKASLLRGERRDASPFQSETEGSMSSDRAGSGNPAASDPTDVQVTVIPQAEQLKNPDARIALTRLSELPLFSRVALAYQGISTGDNPFAVAKFWEVWSQSAGWDWIQSSASHPVDFGGREHLLRLEVLDSPTAAVRGREAWGKSGVSVSQTGRLIPTRYTGEYFANIIPVVVPHDQTKLPAVWCFCESGEMERDLRTINQKLSVDNGYFGKIPFDLDRWQKVAAERYPHGLPEPYSVDPTQWLFHGNPAHAEPGTELHVGVARLLGHRWPAESDPEMRLSDEARELIDRSKELDAKGFSNEDGIVCLSPVRGEGSAALRLRELMAAAYGSEWTSTSERELLERTAAADHGKGTPARSLDEWLRKRFFEEHCRLFHHRPFVWHGWDGLTDGFNALVSYHKLAGREGEGRRTLESLTYTYLGEWIERQRAAQQSGKEGAGARLAAAQGLQRELERILEGKPPYDIFVRWKPLHEQPLGWEPDRDDGVLLNIRPFMKADDVGRSGAGILRWKPNCKWTPDRGKEVESLRPREEFPWFWGCDPKENPEHRIDFGADTPQATPAGEAFDGRRWNDLHYTRAAKEAAREATTSGSPA